MSQAQRKNEILQMIARDGEVNVDDLASHFGVSDMTVRRDLAALAKAGKVSRTHGGAVLSRVGVVEFAFKEKKGRNQEQKVAIAREIAAAIEPGMTVLLDTGSTTLEVARAIAGVPRLTVLTTSLVIASALYTRENIELILLGGTVRRGSPDLSGPLTEDNLGRFRVDVAVLGADGAAEAGVFTECMTVARVSHAITKAAGCAILAIDSSKFEAPAFVKYADWNEFGRVVTDSGVDSATRSWLDEVAAEVTYV